MGKEEKRERGGEDCSKVRENADGKSFQKTYCINILLLQVPMKPVHRDLDSARSCSEDYSPLTSRKNHP